MRQLELFSDNESVATVSLYEVIREDQGGYLLSPCVVDPEGRETGLGEYVGDTDEAIEDIAMHASIDITNMHGVKKVIVKGRNANSMTPFFRRLDLPEKLAGSLGRHYEGEVVLN